MIWEPLLLSLRVTLVATLLLFGVGLILAIFLARLRFPGRLILETLITLPLVLPPSVVGYYLLLVLGRGSPLVEGLGLDILFTWQAAALAAAVVGLPLMVQAARAAIAGVSPSLENAARTLGSSELAVLWRVTLPLAKRGILVGLVLGAARALGEFGATLMVAGSIPGRTQTMPLAIYDAVQSRQYDLANQMVLIMTTVAFLGLWWVRRQEQPKPLSLPAPRGAADGSSAGNPGLYGPDAASTPGSPQSLATPGQNLATDNQHPAQEEPAEKNAPRLTVDIEVQREDFRLHVQFAMGSEVLVLFGPSGAGKTTTLNAIAGLLNPISGEIALDGRALFRKQSSGATIRVPARDRHTGYVFQDYALFPHLTALQNVAYPLWGRQGRERQAMALLHRMGLAHLAHRYPYELSGGQQQRVALARALSEHPRILVLDEPFAAVDAPLRAQLRQEVQALQRRYGILTLFVTHDLAEAIFVGDRIAVFGPGRIHQIGTPEEILMRPQDLHVARAVGVKNILPGQVLQATPQGLTVQVGERALTTPPYPFAVGTAVYLCLRPERILLQRKDLAPRPRGNVVHGQVVGEINDGLNCTLFFRTDPVRLLAQEPYDLQIDLPVYVYERLGLAHTREWDVALTPGAIHVIEGAQE